MAKRKSNVERICDLRRVSTEPTDDQLKTLMGLVGDDARNSIRMAGDIVRQRRRQAIANGHERRQKMVSSLSKTRIVDA